MDDVRSSSRDAGEALYGIADLAEAFGVTPRAIRFYEDKGLLHPRRVGQQRIYTEADKRRLSLILRAKAIGSKLSDIKTFLDLYGREGEGRERQLRFVIEKTAEKIAELEDKRAQIDTTLAELKVIHDGAKERLARRVR
ncbi:MerR family DNA-binding transcriptional regulator [Marinicauda algicola]|uniref:MerR family DNA-binding transcriptional regulator n=1 Tax=Marinicauda algicola TaxID=2029849 RepID=A0A4V6RF63_9PROT|nr:MerR family DNA-binding transcriptional regulator [Marinicauda algicola]TGY90429.1 MerR family DNA-binding transcriptional regulator [Marinicauda algicola]